MEMMIRVLVADFSNIGLLLRQVATTESGPFRGDSIAKHCTGGIGFSLMMPNSACEPRAIRTRDYQASR
jgi:hypothetical protein